MNRKEYKKYAEQYINTLPSTKKSDKTILSYSIILKKFGDYLNSLEQDGEIEPITVVNFRTELYTTNVKTNTIRYDMTVLHTFFEWAKRMHLIEQNPVEREEIPKEQQIEYNLLSLDEIKTVLTELPPRINRKTALRNRAIVILLVQVGLRNSELRMLTPADLDFENKCIEVKHGKGEKRRIVAFPALARQLVKEYLESAVRPSNLSLNDYLFGTDADENGLSTNGMIWKPISAQGLLGIVNRYTRLCCGHEVGVHALRHAAASLWDNMGIGMRDIQNALGHSSIALTEKTYVNILNKSKAANTINAAFDGAL